MKLYATVAAVTGILAYGASTAGAAPLAGARVQLTGQTYHVAACGAAAAGNARCGVHIVTDSAGNPIRLGSAGKNVTFTCQTLVPATCLGPQQLRAAYGITGTGKSTTTVAIVDAFAYPNAAADLATFRANYGLGPAYLTIVNQNGGSTPPPFVDAGWDVEQALDLDMVSTMCPSCHILLVQTNTNSFANLAAGVNRAAAMGAHVISNSYGGGEFGSQSYEFAYNHPGVAITASTGDSGYGAQFPATSPHVIAVGGTTMNMNGTTRLSERVWGGTGSGCSDIWPMPYWQAHTYTNMANNTLCTGRMEADVSADADPGTGAVIYINIPPFTPGFYRVGGTSEAAPLVGGIFGERNDTVLYGRNLYVAPSSAFHDVTLGNNGACGLGYFCTGEVGYDGPTGLGSPNGDSAF